MPESVTVGTLREKSLHAALKAWYAQPDGEIEKPVAGYIVDVVRGDLLIEIQTASFGSIKDKLTNLLALYPVRLTHPIALERWVVRVAGDGCTQLSRRKSPKRGRVEQVFDELVYLSDLAAHPRLTVEVLLTREEVIWCDDRQGSWRRGRWSIQDRRLIEVIGQITLSDPADFAALLPADLARPFTNRDLAQAAGLPLRLAQRMNYCLHKMGALAAAGKRGRALLYQ